MESRDRSAQALTSTFRTRLLAGCLLLFGAAFVQDPGLLVADTKFDLSQAPGIFLGRALHLWDGGSAFGQLQNQAYGYLWPMGPFFAIGAVLDLPGWAIQRLWMGLVLAVAFLGTARLARALGVRSEGACLLAGVAFALSPRMLSVMGPISIEAWPSAIAPWVLLPLVRGASSGSPRRAAAVSGLMVACVGGVNAAATFAVLPLGALWLLTRTPGPRRRTMMLWWPIFTLTGTLWWLIPLFVLGAYSPPFLEYIESTTVTTFPTTLFDALRGTSNWVPYVAASSRAGNDLLTTPYLILNSGVVLLIGSLGLTDRRTPHRSFLALSIVLGVVMVTAGHVGATQGWFAEDIRLQLDGALAPLRNVHKFDPILRLPLVLGLAFAIDHILTRERGPALAEIGDDGEESGVGAWVTRTNRIAFVGVAFAVVAGSAMPIALGRIAPAGSTLEVPNYWIAASTWLDDNAEEATALVVPGTGFADYLWGAPQDEPLQYLSESPWAVRNAIPLSPPGNIRMLDEIETRLAQGDGSKALVGFLRRAGVQYVVVRNDLRRSDDTPDPVLVHAAIEDSPGMARVASFGPEIGGDPTLVGEDGERILVNGGWQSRHPAIEIYEVPGLAAFAVSTKRPVVVAGGPEDLLDLLRLDVIGETPTVLAADGVQALVSGDGSVEAPMVLTDGLRARERSFARLHDGVSAMTTPGDVRRSGNKARDFVIDEDQRWSSTVSLEGAKAISASSSASDSTNPTGSQRGKLPRAAIDGDSSTQWATRPFTNEPAWWRIDLDEPVTDEAVLIGGRDAPENQVIRLRTDQGVTDPQRLAPGQQRRIALPAGTANWIKIEEASETGGRPMALAEVVLPGVVVESRLILPDIPEKWGSPSAIVLRRDRDARKGCVVVDEDVRCVPGRENADEEASGMRRGFRLPEFGVWEAQMTVVPKGGAALDDLILENQPVTISSSSVGVTDTRASPVSTIDGDSSTTWISDADDIVPALDISWLGRSRVQGISLKLDRNTAARAPTQVVLTWPGGRERVDLDDGQARFDPIFTDRLQITVTASEPATSLGFDASGIDLGIGVTELQIDGNRYLPLQLPEDAKEYPCGSGPTLSVVGGDTLRTSPLSSPASLHRGETVPARVCGDTMLALPPGKVAIDVEPSDEFESDAVVLRPLATAATQADTMSEGADYSAFTRSPAERRIVPGSGAGLVVLRQNANEGWSAVRDGRDLAPVMVDGWQQGWVLNPTSEGAVVAQFGPDRLYRISLIGGLLSFLVLLGGVLWGALPGRGRKRSLLPPLTERLLPVGTMPLVAVVLGGVLAGWVGAIVSAIGVMVLQVAARRYPETDLFAALPMLIAAAAYALAPWGSPGGWAGNEGWITYVLLIPLVAILTLTSEAPSRTGSI